MTISLEQAQALELGTVLEIVGGETLYQVTGRGPHTDQTVWVKVSTYPEINPGLDTFFDERLLELITIHEAEEGEATPPEGGETPGGGEGSTPETPDDPPDPPIKRAKAKKG